MKSKKILKTLLMGLLPLSSYAADTALNLRDLSFDHIHKCDRYRNHRVYKDASDSEWLVTNFTKKSDKEFATQYFAVRLVNSLFDKELVPMKLLSDAKSKAAFAHPLQSFGDLVTNNKISAEELLALGHLLGNSTNEKTSGMDLYNSFKYKNTQPLALASIDPTLDLDKISTTIQSITDKLEATALDSLVAEWTEDYTSLAASSKLDATSHFANLKSRLSSKRTELISTQASLNTYQIMLSGDIAKLINHLDTEHIEEMPISILGTATVCIAIKNGYTDIIDDILFDEANAKLFKQTCDGHSLIHYATIYDSPEMVTQLIESHEADSKEIDADGNSLLMLAAANNALLAADVLIANEADVNAKTPQNRTALIHCTLTNHLDFAKKLLDNGAKETINQVEDFEGNTALHFAAKFNFHELVQLLKDNGADATIKNAAELTALEVATDAKSTETIAVLSK